MFCQQNSMMIDLQNLCNSKHVLKLLINFVTRLKEEYLIPKIILKTICRIGRFFGKIERNEKFYKAASEHCL